MTKKFISRKRKKKNKLILIIILVLTIYSVNKMELKPNYKLINAIFSNYSLNNKQSNIIKDFLKINLKDQLSIINYSINDLATFDMEEEPGTMSSYIEDPTPTTVTNPLVYIYNTHQTEAYQTNTMFEYNIEPTVLMSSYLLREKLNELNIETLVETGNISEVLQSNNWPYSRSYDASKILVEPNINKYKSIKLVIDIHRDSSIRSKTTIDIDNKQYAKVLFVVGKEHPNYLNNLSVTNKLNDSILEINKNLSRGVIIKEGPGVNGIYNQDLHQNSILIELGGQYNYIDEASNTIELLANVISKLLEEL